MLSKVLSKNTCANCRFCCSFRRCSLWETPIFPNETVSVLEDKGYHFIKNDGYGLMDLKDSYKTDDSQEEAPCYFLDSKSGCSLSEDEKPFDCKIWPIRIMKDEEGRRYITIATTCKAVKEIGIEPFKELVNDGLYKVISDYADSHPYMVKDFTPDYPIIKELQ